MALLSTFTFLSLFVFSFFFYLSIFSYLSNISFALFFLSFFLFSFCSRVSSVIVCLSFHLTSSLPCPWIFKGILKGGFRLHVFSWISFSRALDYTVGGHLTFLRKFAEIFESKGWLPVSTSPVSLTPVINTKLWLAPGIFIKFEIAPIEYPRARGKLIREKILSKISFQTPLKCNYLLYQYFILHVSPFKMVPSKYCSVVVNSLSSFL